MITKRCRYQRLKEQWESAQKNKCRKSKFMICCIVIKEGDYILLNISILISFLILSFYDILIKEIPVIPVIMLAVLVCFDRIVFGGLRIDSIILDTFPVFVMLIFGLFLPKQSIGAGDIYLFAVIGVAYGFCDLITVIFFSSVIFIVVIFLLKPFIPFNKKTTVGFVPFISISTASLICL